MSICPFSGLRRFLGLSGAAAASCGGPVGAASGILRLVTDGQLRLQVEDVLIRWPSIPWSRCDHGL